MEAPVWAGGFRDCLAGLCEAARLRPVLGLETIHQNIFLVCPGHLRHGSYRMRRCALAQPSKAHFSRLP